MGKIDTLGTAGLLHNTQLEASRRDVNQAKELAKSQGSNAKEIEKAATGFEALLLHQMLKAMWSTVQTEGLLGEDSNQARIYRDMLNQAIADSVAEGRGIGVKEFLTKELSRLKE